MATASFPIPVLGNGQGEERDVTSEWRVGNFTFASGTEDVTIHFRVFHDDPDLKRLLDNGDARIMARWICRQRSAPGPPGRASSAALQWASIGPPDSSCG